MDPETYEIIDFTQYRMYLDEVNQKGIPYWNISYTFKDYFGVNKMTPENVRKMYDKFNVFLVGRVRIYRRTR